MAVYAVELGVPINAITAETESQSTLQNTLFSLPYLKGANRIILVTEGFHLPRSWAALQWAALHEGRSFDIALANSTPFRHSPPTRKFPAAQ